MHCRCNVLINHITRSMVLTVMMTVCMMNSRYSRLLPTMLLLHSIHDILSADWLLRWVRKMVYIGISGIRPLHLGCDQSGALVGEKLGGEYKVHGGYDYVQICSVRGVCSRLMSVVYGLSVQSLCYVCLDGVFFCAHDMAQH